MKNLKTLVAATAVAAGLPFGAFVSTASAEVSSSATISNAYLWRGFELGSGTPAVSADLVFSESGAYAGLWISSGDTTGGTEYDIFFGYGGSAGDFSYDIQYITYVYPTGSFFATDGSPGDFAEVVLSLGYGPFSFVYKDNVAGETGGYAFNKDYSYVSIGASSGDFGIAIGQHDEGALLADTVTGDATHLDLSYAANESLTFTFSTIISSQEGYVEPEPLFNVSYSVPIL